VSRTTAYELPLVDVERKPGGAGGDPLAFRTIRGDIVGRYHPVGGGLATRAVVLIPGLAGGLGGPAHGLYETLASDLRAAGVEALRLDYRRVSKLEECVRDAVVGTHWLARERGIERIAVLGHGFGGAVAITAGVAADEVAAVAALSAPIAGTEAVAWLGKPLFLGHGEQDEVEPSNAVERLADRAAGEVTCRIYPGARHDLGECRTEVAADLMAWIDEHL